MSELLSIAGNNTSVIAQTSQGVPAKSEAATNNPAQNIAQNGGQAAIVSLSASSVKRAPSSGEKKAVDSSFDNQVIKEKREEKEGGKDGGKKKAVDVSA